MPAANLLALIDDIATVLDDVAVLTKVATKKTAGVLGDDLGVGLHPLVVPVGAGATRRRVGGGGLGGLTPAQRQEQHRESGEEESGEHAGRRASGGSHSAMAERVATSRSVSREGSWR